MAIERGTYLVHMWLYPNPPLSCVSEFEERFPEELAREWWNLEYTVDNGADLANQMNRQITRDCASWLERDFGREIREAQAFSASIWSPGGGGQHEGKGAIIARDPALGQWRFGSCTMYANCRIVNRATHAS